MTSNSSTIWMNRILSYFWNPKFAIKGTNPEIPSWATTHPPPRQYALSRIARGGICPPHHHETGREPVDSSSSSQFSGWLPLSASWLIPFTPALLQNLRHYYRVIAPFSCIDTFPLRGPNLYGFLLKSHEGFHVPHKSLNQGHAAFTPGTTQTVNTLPLGSSRGSPNTPECMPSQRFQHLFTGFLLFVSLILTCNGLKP